MALLAVSSTAFAQLNLLYVPNTTSGSLSDFSISGAGALGLLNNPSGLSGAYEAVVSSDNRFVYVGAQPGQLYGFQVNPATGALSAAPTSQPPAVGAVHGLAIGGGFLYSSDDTNKIINVYPIHSDGTLGAAVAPGFSTASLGTPHGLATDSAGHLFVALWDTGLLASFSTSSTGVLSQIGSTVPAGIGPERIAVSGGFVFATHFGGVVRIPVNGSGALQSAGVLDTTVGVSPLGLVIHPDGILYVGDFISSPGQVFAFRSLSSSPLTSVGTFSMPAGSTAAGAGPVGLTIDPTGGFLLVANGSDTASGPGNITRFTITRGGATPGALTAGAIATASVSGPRFLASAPSPAASAATVPTLSTWSLLALAVLLAASSAFLYQRAWR